MTQEQDITLYADLVEACGCDPMNYDVEELEYMIAPIVDEDVPHPLLVALRDGATVRSVDVIQEWMDDHIACFAIKVATDDEVYAATFWHMGSEILLDLGKTINNKEQSAAFAEMLLT